MPRRSISVNFRQVAIVLVWFSCDFAATKQADNGQTSWSVELSSVTTLAPPSRLAEATNFINHKTDQNQALAPSRESQENMFDDSARDALALGFSPSYRGTSEPQASTNHLTASPLIRRETYRFGLNDYFVGGANLSTSNGVDDRHWVPKMITTTSSPTSPFNYQVLPAPSPMLPYIEDEQRGNPLGLLSPATFDLGNNQLSYQSLNNIGSYFGGHAVPLKDEYVASTHGNAQLPPISREVLRRALAIQREKMLESVRGKTQLGQLQQKPARNSNGLKMNRLSNSFKMLGKSNKLDEYQMVNSSAQNRRTSKVRDELVFFSPAAAAGTEFANRRTIVVSPSDEVLDLDSNTDYQQFPSAAHLNELQARIQEHGGRGSEMDSNHLVDYGHHHSPNARSLLASSSKFLHSAVPVYVTSPGHYPHHKQVAIATPRHGHEKGLITPILVGIAAALISFLIISNLFLSIPLLAMTLFSFFNGNMMMMMMPSNGNNGNSQITPMPQLSNQNNGQQPSQGKRRKRRNAIGLLEPEVEARILLVVHNFLSQSSV